MWVRAVAGDLNLADQAAHIQGWWRGKSRLERAGLGDRALATMMPTSALGSRRPRALASSCGKREHAPLTHGHSPAVLAALAGRQRMQVSYSVLLTASFLLCLRKLLILRESDPPIFPWLCSYFRAGENLKEDWPKVPDDPRSMGSELLPMAAAGGSTFRHLYLSTYNSVVFFGWGDKIRVRKK
ncbi:uncharacterized protein LOC112270679 [Brachypodium distachyon]|uniref:uncharacterized protein LOC112270679 n=1 Tax=Brachypodium distachyon TaxID=15368 RepID=UPI000D0CDC10|nr:uncharacterized protein LOC112270679 [Brachypodium distachyon]|eukprot:XP_024314450.1 uncharacterized protein LOC112270679 [Brachypodium distachyon]